MEADTAHIEKSPARFTCPDLKQGAEVTFKPCHIARTIIKKGDPRWIECANQKALVSEMCFATGECVRFLYRQDADRKEDSGWRMFTGHETQEYNDDPKSVRVVEVGCVCSTVIRLYCNPSKKASERFLRGRPKMRLGIKLRTGPRQNKRHHRFPFLRYLCFLL